MKDNNLIIYKNSDGNIAVEAIYKDETLWLSQIDKDKNVKIDLNKITERRMAYR